MPFFEEIEKKFVNETVWIFQEKRQSKRYVRFKIIHNPSGNTFSFCYSLTHKNQPMQEGFILNPLIWWIAILCATAIPLLSNLISLWTQPLSSIFYLAFLPGTVWIISLKWLQYSEEQYKKFTFIWISFLIPEYWFVIISNFIAWILIVTILVPCMWIFTRYQNKRYFSLLTKLEQLLLKTKSNDDKRSPLTIHPEMAVKEGDNRALEKLDKVIIKYQIWGLRFVLLLLAPAFAYSVVFSPPYLNWIELDPVDKIISAIIFIVWMIFSAGSTILYYIKLTKTSKRGYLLFLGITLIYLNFCLLLMIKNYTTQPLAQVFLWIALSSVLWYLKESLLINHVRTDTFSRVVEKVTF